MKEEQNSNAYTHIVGVKFSNSAIRLPDRGSENSKMAASEHDKHCTLSDIKIPEALPKFLVSRFSIKP